MEKALSRIGVIIDPQNMFMPIDGMPLPVEGADKDMKRTAEYLINNPHRYNAIIVTLDTHPEDHIAHAVRWCDQDGNEPSPFTLITAADYQAGLWRAANPEDQEVQQWYLLQLEEMGRVHTIWPPHGDKYTDHHLVYVIMRFALNIWEKKTGKKVQYIEKGMHRDTEQFGVFAADVPIHGAPETSMNIPLIDEINSFDSVDFFGEASSHCVKDSVEQYLQVVSKADYSKVTVFRDTMSPVAAVVDEDGNVIPEADFPAQAEAWLDGLPVRGVAVDTVAHRMAS